MVDPRCTELCIDKHMSAVGLPLSNVIVKVLRS